MVFNDLMVNYGFDELNVVHLMVECDNGVGNGGDD